MGVTAGSDMSPLSNYQKSGSTKLGGRQELGKDWMLFQVDFITVITCPYGAQNVGDYVPFTIAESWSKEEHGSGLRSRI